MDFSKMKVALVTDWLTVLAGGEKVLKAVADIFPTAPIFTTVTNPAKIGEFNQREIHTSFLQKVPYFHKKHQMWLPLLPYAIESLDLKGYDLVISFSSCVAKSVITHPHQCHICYIHSPMRYVWEPYLDARINLLPKFLHPLTHALYSRLRVWDKSTSSRPDLYIANSLTTQARVRRYYEKDTKILYPPVDLSRFKLADQKADFYLAAGRMVPYKSFDLLIDTFRTLPERQLKIIGDGVDRPRLMKLAKDCPNIEFLGRVSDEVMTDTYSKAKYFLLPQMEDAGITQIEALASGTPVIAFKAGGALDVIQDQENGLFFAEQTVEALAQKIVEADQFTQWDSQKLRDSVARYDVKIFQNNFLDLAAEQIQKIV
ncbi:MAG TPA: glycosyltransferase [Candidatus Gracilibacteria bacterium]|nr:glycosyltransferase [Candidatus Gracilibacteria bacterium]